MQVNLPVNELLNVKKVPFFAIFFKFLENSYIHPLKNQDNTNSRKLFGSRSVLEEAVQDVRKASKFRKILLAFPYLRI